MFRFHSIAADAAVQEVADVQPSCDNPDQERVNEVAMLYAILVQQKQAGQHLERLVVSCIKGQVQLRSPEEIEEDRLAVIIFAVVFLDAWHGENLFKPVFLIETQIMD